MRILKIVLCLLVFANTTANFAQDFTADWTGHYSYLDIKDVTKSQEKLYVAATNAVFTYDFISREIHTISTINGLSGDDITTVLYIEDKSILLIGYDNGLIQVYDEIDNSVFSVVDILEKQTIPAASKKINQFYRFEDVVYISTGFGISVYDINQLEFGDTYYIGPNNTQINVNQTTVFNGFIHAASSQGMYKGELANPNLIDAAEWQSINANNWVGIQKVQDNLYAALSNNKIYEVVNSNFIEKTTIQGTVSDFKSVDNHLVITATNLVKVYSNDFSEVYSTIIDVSEYSNLNTALIANQDEVFIGTKAIVNSGNAGLGILKTSYFDQDVYEEIHPTGPLKNRFFQININGNHLWGTHGGHNAILNFEIGDYRRTGLSYFNSEEWDNIPYKTFNESVANPFFLTGIVINPFNINQVYVTSYNSGLIELTNREITNYFNQDNSTLSPFYSNFYLTSKAVFNEDGELWVMNGRVDQPLNIYSNNQWSSFSFQDVIPDPFDENGFFDTVFDDSGNFFLGTHRFGIIGLNKNGNNITFNHLSEEEEGMPSPSVKTLTIDNNGQLWLGTDKGLRIVYNTDQFVNGEAEVDNIVVLDDGIARELLFQQYITDIEVDGSNNKWVATLDTGLYYFSSDGQETIFHFTKDNSPLPTNDILDVDIDDVNGVVYIATDKGMVSYKSEASKPQVTLENAYVYPNPVRPNFNIISDKVKIRDLSENVNIKILDIEGNLVAEAETNTNSRFKGYNLEIDGGTALWNGKNLGGNIVASGVYLIMLNDLDTFETKVLKVMVVR
ncbi:ABC transporter substrate-binding protein [Olleya aquimaris]|nr:ABC transporter substrate-binding protein [Olleya aquimaris]